MKLTDIIGLEPKHAALLEKEGIKKAEDLLPLNYNQIKKLANKIGVVVELVDTWQEHADLMRISGITPEIANAINIIGVDSVKEFAHRNPKTTLDKLKQLKTQDPKVIKKIPTQTQIEKWIKRKY